MAEEQIATPENKAPLDVDALLDELDPDFKAQLGIITSEIAQIGPITGLESMSISDEYLTEGPKADDDTEAKKIEPPKPDDVALTLSLSQILFELIKQTLILPLTLGRPFIKLLMRIKGEGAIVVLQNAREAFSQPLQEWLVCFLALVKKVSTFKRATYIRLAIIVALLVVLKFLLIDMKRHLNPDEEKDPFLKSWQGVADQSYDIPKEDDAEDLLNPLRHPEYTVLVHRIVSNLKPKNSKAAPMLAAELYVEASNQDCAIEIHERDLEVRDAIERVFEETTYDDVDTTPGKERLKVRIRESLDKFLTKGHVKRIFFSSINIAP